MQIYSIILISSFRRRKVVITSQRQQHSFVEVISRKEKVFSQNKLLRKVSESFMAEKVTLWLF